MQTVFSSRGSRQNTAVLRTDDCDKKNPVDCTWMILKTKGNTDKEFEVVIGEHSGKDSTNC